MYTQLNALLLCLMEMTDEEKVIALCAISYLIKMYEIDL